jgi:DNA (cytosine-5)-methyltransferase 1
MMKYGSICSGVEAASLAWEPLGWQPQWFAEIEKFPSAVLAHHWPTIPNLGDITDDHFTERTGAVDLLVGGTPCQSFSVAGLRGGLDDDRGNLALRFCQIVDQLTPTWVVWENVPGVLSSNGGKDFGSILGALVECGYGFAYRILDAQFFGVAQRRRRVFVVGYLGDWRPPAAVLFERKSLLGHTEESAKARQEVASDVGGGASYSRTGNERVEADALVPTVAGAVSAKWAKGTGGPAGDEAYNLVTVNAREDPIHTSGKSLPLGAKDTGHAIAFLPGQGADAGTLGIATEQAPTLRSGCDNYGVVAIAFSSKDDGSDLTTDRSPTIRSQNPPAVTIGMDSEFNTSKNRMGPLKAEFGGNPPAISQSNTRVRRLTPIECERLQGMPDNHTRIPWRKKPAAECPDGPRYKAIGNSMAVPVMRWIGERIIVVQQIIEDFK